MLFSQLSISCAGKISKSTYLSQPVTLGKKSKKLLM